MYFVFEKYFFIIGVWVPFKNKKINKIAGGLGVMSVQNSFEFAFSEFYFGLVISLIMIVVYFCIDKIVKE